MMILSDIVTANLMSPWLSVIRFSFLKQNIIKGRLL